jgi:hypothetical protein
MIVRNIAAILHSFLNKQKDAEKFIGVYGNDWLGILWFVAVIISI